jgi:hypothetical protein
MEACGAFVDGNRMRVFFQFRVGRRAPSSLLTLCGIQMVAFGLLIVLLDLD